jgi:hypothetical protein
MRRVVTGSEMLSKEFYGQFFPSIAVVSSGLFLENDRSLKLIVFPLAHSKSRSMQIADHGLF